MKVLFDAQPSQTNLPITERVQSFEDACKVLGMGKIELGTSGLHEDEVSIVAYAKLVIIARALNEGWKPDWSNYSQIKYIPWFKHNAASGFGLSFYDYADWDTLTAVGSRLCFKSSELATYAGKQFEALYNEFLTIKP